MISEGTRRNFISLISGGLALGVGGCAPRPNTRLEDIRLSTPPEKTELEILRTAASLPALGLGVSDARPRSSQQPDMIFACGERQLGSQVAVTAQDRWHLGSLTKAFTATLVARYVEAGMLSWSTTIGSVLADRIGDIRSEHRTVTILHLLSHRSGIPAHAIDWAALRYPREESDPRASRLAFTQTILQEAPAARAGEQFIYSNRGYIVLGTMLEVLFGSPWEQQLSHRLLMDLGMREFGFGAPGTAGRLDQPVGHASWITPSQTPHPPGSYITDNPVVWGPAGRLHASLQDLLRFLKAHRDRAALLSSGTWTMLHTAPFDGQYALGWFVSPDSIWHDGTNTLFNSRAVVGLDGRTCAAAVCNDGDYGRSQPALQLALSRATHRE